MTHTDDGIDNGSGNATDGTGEQPIIAELRLWEMVFPDHTNHLGSLFGGQALAWMDKAAFLVASRFARRTVVTASSERIDFHAPVRQGQAVELIARLLSIGRSSMQVEVELQAENLHTGNRVLCTRGRFIMIALDDSGRPAAIQRDTDQSVAGSRTKLPPP